MRSFYAAVLCVALVQPLPATATEWCRDSRIQLGTTIGMMTDRDGTQHAVSLISTASIKRVGSSKTVGWLGLDDLGGLWVQTSDPDLVKAFGKNVGWTWSGIYKPLLVNGLPSGYRASACTP